MNVFTSKITKSSLYRKLSLSSHKLSSYIKTKKCQPAAGDTPDLIKTECVPDSGLARPNKKISERKNKRKSYLNGKVSKFENCWKSSKSLQQWSISRKIRNVNTRSYNGNRKNTISVLHWNLGSRLWTNKLNDIMDMLAVRQPDLPIISEANILNSDLEHELFVPGYKLILPKTMQFLGNCRIALLVRDCIDIQLLDRYMDCSISSIWMKLSCKGRKAIHVGAIYREHKYIRQEEPNISGSFTEQNKRWRIFLDQWERACISADTIVVGDFNLDKNKWLNPDQDHLAMVNMMKTRI